MAKINRPSDEELITLIKAKKGNISEVAASIRPYVSRQTVYKWIDKSKKLKAALDEAKEVALDMVEGRMMSLIQGVPRYARDKEGKLVYDKTGNPVIDSFIISPDVRLIMFYLKTQGKSRGYVEKTEVDVTQRIYEVDFSEE